MHDGLTGGEPGGSEKGQEIAALVLMRENENLKQSKAVGMERRGTVPEIILMMDGMCGIREEGGVKADSEVSYLGDWMTGW